MTESGRNNKTHPNVWQNNNNKTTAAKGRERGRGQGWRGTWQSAAPFNANM